MDPNTHSTRPSAGQPDWLGSLATVVDGLATQDLDRLGDVVRAERVLVLRRLVDRLEGQWLKELAGVDARGAAGADQAQRVGSTAAWLRGRLRLGAGAASGAVRTARALFGGPLTQTAAALTAGAISAAHASVLAHATKDLPAHLTMDAEPVLVEAAAGLDPPRLRRVVEHLRLVADPDGADAQAERGHARRALEGGRLPQAGGVRPQLAVTVDLDSLLGRAGALGGEVGWAGPLPPEACRRLACDSAVTRVLVTHPADHRPATHSTRPPRVPQGRGGGAAAGRDGPAAPSPGRRRHPTVGGRPDQPGRPTRPADRPGRPRRQLCRSRL
jgi:hypothetical protein